ncbi:SGNH/GDSL hydrolase family protein [Sporichthya sp.]|uniref:SGNH/GDSL hydrolase family protein n=1 Tax=Sporichthya sp. TaxID=65475 RepID=UPI0018408355|nr:SGNH/GDSL hydrolase family protein [Sporichthya sp.]MBA3741651.1 SGNH/GDSL hydrolase family protein [Sporichthya sp.]
MTRNLGTRLLQAAALGTTGVALTGGALAGVLMTEAKLARHWVGKPKGEPAFADGLYGSGPGRQLTMAMLGDSMAAGLGVATPEETPAALIAQGLSERANAPVRLTNVALVGAQSTDLDRQVTLALAARADVAMIMIGANDVTHRIQPSLSCAMLQAAVRRLREAGCEVVVGTCPDLGTIEPIAQPLRYLARRWSRQLAAAQTIVVVENGGRTVSLGDLCATAFVSNPREMFSDDRFHPSAAGYAAAAMAVLPSVCAALGFVPAAEIVIDPTREEEMLPVAIAAVEAVDRPGTEVAPVGAVRSDGGRRWALLKHRRRHELPEDATANAA